MVLHVIVFEYLTAHSVYEIDLIFAVGQQENSLEAMRVYPNPTSGTIYIMGAQNTRVSLYSPSGTLVKSVEIFNAPSFNIPDVSNGVYMLRVERTNGTVIQKKIVVVK
ncbi:MAG: T9SS type A sorting domain-containing protein [Bacteroidales bacterium]|nr:T9SS type A sorting domain-containing protein [Bacteroidales bacterium]